MLFLSRCLHVLVGFIVLSLGLWLVTSYVDRCDSSKLVRAGLLVLGLCGIAWGLRRDEGRLVATGLLLLAVGVLCFHLDGLDGRPGLVSRLAHRSGAGYRFCRSLLVPLQWHLDVPMGYVILGAWIVVNAMMFIQRMPSRTVIIANLCFLAGVALVHLMRPY